METTIFQAHPEIIQIVFEVLDAPTLLNCRLVCKSWNQFLETPTFWLKKLREIGQPAKIETKWKTLIAKSEDSMVQKCVFAKCLRMKFRYFQYGNFFKHKKICKTGRKCECDTCKKYSMFFLSCPPLYTAAKFGFDEIVKLTAAQRGGLTSKIFLSQNLSKFS